MRAHSLNQQVLARQHDRRAQEWPVLCLLDPRRQQRQGQGVQ